MVAPGLIRTVLHSGAQPPSRPLPTLQMRNLMFVAGSVLRARSLRTPLLRPGRIRHPRNNRMRKILPRFPRLKRRRKPHRCREAKNSAWVFTGPESGRTQNQTEQGGGDIPQSYA